MKQKQVVNLCDGKQLGRVCDIVFSFPEGAVQGLVAPGGKGLRFGKADLFIDIKNVVKIGVDTVLVEVKSAPPKEKKRGERGEYASLPPPQKPAPAPYPRGEGFSAGRRDYSEYE